MLVAYLPFLVRAMQIYASTTFRKWPVLAPTAQTFREFLEQQEIFIFFITIYVGRRSDRERSTRQCPADLSLEAADAHSNMSPAKRQSCCCSCCRDVGSGELLLLIVQVMFAGSLAFVRNNAFLFPAITVYAFIQVLLATFDDARAVVAVEERRFVVDHVRRRHLLHRCHLRHAEVPSTATRRFAWCRRRRRAWQQIGDVIFRVPPRHDTPVVLSLLVLAS